MKCFLNSVAVQSRVALAASAGKQRRLSILALATLMVISVVMTRTSPASDEGATQISGIAEFGGEIPQPDDYEFFLVMPEGNGDLEGTLSWIVEGYGVTPSGNYREWGRELFEGSYNGESGTFETTYVFTAKFDEGGEIFGRCQHPIVEGSGTGVFEGVTGRIDFKDDVETGEFFYRGHLQW